MFNYHQLGHIVRKPDFCQCKNKGTDQLRSTCEDDQRLYFRYTDSTISLLKSEISSFLSFSVAAQAGLCQTWSETPKASFLASRLNYHQTDTPLPSPLIQTDILVQSSLSV